MRKTAHDRHPTSQGTPTRWLRPAQVRALTAAMLTVSLLLGGAFLAVDRLHATPADVLDHPADPIGDDQTRAQVIDAARQVVTVARLNTSSAGYALMSCKDRFDPPYQGAVYLTFALPAGARAFSYFPAIVRALRARGWTQGLPANDHAFGTTLSKDDATAVIYRQNEDPGLGIVRVYGQCRDMHDHTDDATAWTDVTDEFAKTG
ncbi:hypothetical protein [Mycobacterium helveticum]|nr:hypothetical protein [Mycobacterium helveticum]